VTLDNGSGVRHALDKVNFTIGRAPDCDLQVGGWWAPRVAASIQRRQDGCYLLPKPRGRVSLNGRRVWRAVLLEDGDHLRVRGLPLTFALQPIAGR
jgi:predicted component of type VI protein secretion system